MKLASVLLIAYAVTLALYLQSSTPLDDLSVRAQEWRVDGDYFLYQQKETLANYLIFYKETKKSQNVKNTLILVHGFPTSGFDWYKIWDGMLGKFDRIVALDMLGFGFSDKPAYHDYNLLEQADIVESLLLHLNISKAHFIFHDYGVSVGQELLARQLEHRTNVLQSVCFLNGGLFPEMHHPLLLQKLLLNDYIGPVVSAIANYPMVANSMRKIFGPQTQPTEQEIRELWNIIRFNGGHKLNHKLIKYIRDRQINGERWKSAMKQNVQEGSVPVQLINGPADPVSGRHLLEYYQQQITNKDVVLLEDHIGHYPQLEDPQNVVAHYLEFVSPKLNM